MIRKRYVVNLCYIGVPMGLQYSITAIGSTILQAAVNGLGSSYVAAMTAGSKMFNFTCCPFDALGSTMATYGGQNVGAGKIDRLGKGIRAAMIIGCGVQCSGTCGSVLYNRLYSTSFCGCS